MSAPNPATAQQQQGQDASFGNSCDECMQNIPPVTRILCFLSLLGGILGLFGGTTWLGNCAGFTLLHFQVYRLFISSIVDGLFGSLIGILFIIQVGQRLERLKGSVPFLHAVVMISLVTNLLFLAFSMLVAYNPLGRSTAPLECNTQDLAYWCLGMWPVAFGLMVIETQLASDDARPFICCPFTIPTKWYPVFLVLLFELFIVFSGSPRWDMMIGLLVGYLYFRLRKLQLSVERARRWETGMFGPLRNRQGFVSVDAAGIPGGMSDGGYQEVAQTSGIRMNRIGASGSSTTAQPTRPSVFASGTGHRLNEGPGAVNAGIASSAHPNRPGAALADRVARQREGAPPAPPASAAVSVSGPSSSFPRTADATSPINIRLDHVNMGLKTSQSTATSAATGGAAESQLAANLNTLQDLGYARADALNALQHSDGDLQRAVEYLNG